ncbi:MAG TPA: hypothetical protein VH305_02495 [Gaiella sp.]|jgi:phosphohistidine swiveling domain-containing protein
MAAEVIGREEELGSIEAFLARSGDGPGALPAVVGRGTGTKRIRTGDRVRVDADAGTVTILDRA